MENKNKQTAVEWLENEFQEMCKDFGGLHTDFIERFDKAKEMEKQQHENTWFDSTAQFDNSAEMTYKKTFEQYYNKEYGNET